MATGTGKTYTAFQIVYRLLKSETVHKVLYLADRNMLVDQSIEQDFAPAAENHSQNQCQKRQPQYHHILRSIFFSVPAAGGR